MISIETIINYFIKKKFGFLADAYPVMTSLKRSDHNEYAEKISEIDAYRLTLRNMPENELFTLHKRSLVEDAAIKKQKAIQEERERFYNVTSANADFEHWSKAAHWTLDEAIALSFGKEPDVVTWKEIDKLKNKTVFAKAFAKRRDLALRATRWKRFGNTIPPAAFIGWAKEVKIGLPEALLNAVSEMGIVAVNWHEQHDLLKAKYDALLNKPENKQKTESTRKTENVLQAFAAIAIDDYGYDPKSAKSTAPKDIADALSKLGKKVDPKTIRNWLKEGAALLPSNPHKD